MPEPGSLEHAANSEKKTKSIALHAGEPEVGRLTLRSAAAAAVFRLTI
jgi:hypothetical protein